jgi:hypothetical protein
MNNDTSLRCVRPADFTIKIPINNKLTKLEVGMCCGKGRKERLGNKDHLTE